MNCKCLPNTNGSDVVLSSLEHNDICADKLYTISPVGTKIVFADRTITIEQFVPTTKCKKCVFSNQRDELGGPICERFRLCSARFRQDHQSVCFVDEAAINLEREKSCERAREKYQQKKSKD